MTDKRVIRTKRNIKQTLISLLNQESFEKISVSSICREGSTSRITFYNYYPDKYALIEEMLQDYREDCQQYYHELEQQNNAEGNTFIGYLNLLDSLIVMFKKHADFFSHVSPEANPYLHASFFRHVIDETEQYITDHTKGMRSKYPPRQTAALLCSGLLGVSLELIPNSQDRTSVPDDIRLIYRDLLESCLFLQEE